MPIPDHLTADLWRRIGAVIERLQEAEKGTLTLEEVCAVEGLNPSDVRPFLTMPERDDKVFDGLDPLLLADCARELGTESATSLTQGDRLGPYEIDGLIGVGGMGEVYRGRDTRLDRPVAIKLLQPHVAGHTGGRRRLEQEARAISALNHPHICTLFDVGEAPAPYLVMELLEGATLADRLRREPMPTSQCIEYLAQTADALAAAHRQGVVHRDLKPANIMVTTHGVKLLDFGIAALNRSSAASGLDADAGAAGFGTLDYMAPEQLKGGAGDARADIFALGKIASAMFAGRPDVPPAVEWAVERCLAPDPEGRWQSAADLATHLRWSASNAGVSPPAADRKPRRWKYVAAAALVTALVAVAAAIAWPGRDTGTSGEVIRYEIPPPEGSTFERTLALSPDGRRIAFTATDGEGRRAMWIRPLDAVASQPVAGTEGAFYPFWSPDGRFVGFFADQKLKKVELATGLVQIICSTGFGGGGTWNRDDVILFATQSTTSPALLQRVQASGGTPEPVTSQITKAALHAWPQFLPDGRHYLYMRVEPPRASGIFLGVLGSEHFEPLTTLTAEAKDVGPVMRAVGQVVGRARYAGGHLFFVRGLTLWAQKYDLQNHSLVGEPVRVADEIAQDSPGRAAFDVADEGVLVYRTRSEGTLNQLVWIDRSGREAARVGEAGPYGSPSVSPDGRWILADHAGAPGGITRIDSASGTPTPVTKAGMIPVWTADGAELLFRGGGGPAVSIAKADGTEPEGRMVGPAINSWPNQSLKDGRFVGTAIRTETTSWDVFVKTPSAKGATYVVATNADETDPQVSPDGRWLVYAARDESAQWQVLVQPFDRPGRIERVSASGGRYPRWSPAGRELFYVAPDGAMMRALVTPGAEFQVGSIGAIFRHDALIEGFGGAFRSPYDISPDGRFLIAVPAKRPAAVPVSVLLNWPAIVKR
jgi:hypothetical protein